MTEMLLTLLWLFFRVFFGRRLTVYSFNRLCGLKDTVVRWVVCRKCSQVYPEGTAPDVCGHVLWPTHKQSRYRKPCGQRLFFTRHLASGKQSRIPRLILPYQPITAQLERIFNRVGMEAVAQHWRTRAMAEGMYGDVYDGSVWKRFQTVEGKPFLADSAGLTIGLQLNLDWFNAHRHQIYSVGVVYAAILNLPREQRFLRENMLAIMLLPGGEERKHKLQFLLKPMIDELNHLWLSGTTIHTPSSASGRLLRAAVLCVACDSPAARKMCGFRGHKAVSSCTKCSALFQCGTDDAELIASRKAAAASAASASSSSSSSSAAASSVDEKEEKNEGEEEDEEEEEAEEEDQYARGLPDGCGSFCENAERRTVEQHRAAQALLLKADSPAAQTRVSKQTGFSVTALLALPYFDSVEMCVIDPMHSLYLGTAHYVIDFWIEQKILTPAKLRRMQKALDDIELPTDVQGIKRKIGTAKLLCPLPFAFFFPFPPLLGRLNLSVCFAGSKFASVTAAEWKFFACVVGTYLLTPHLPSEELALWRLYADATRLISQRLITERQLDQAHNLFRQFGLLWQKAPNRATRVTSNMHSHLHLRDCVHAFGPVYAFWLFGFERYNGLINSVPSNNRNLEASLLQHIAAHSQLTNCYDLPALQSLSAEQTEWVQTVSGTQRKNRDWSCENTDGAALCGLAALRSGGANQLTGSEQIACAPGVPIKKPVAISDSEFNRIDQSVRAVYARRGITAKVDRSSLVRHQSYHILSEPFGSVLQRNKRNANVMVGRVMPARAVASASSSSSAAAAAVQYELRAAEVQCFWEVKVQLYYPPISASLPATEIAKQLQRAKIGAAGVLHRFAEVSWYARAEFDPFSEEELWMFTQLASDASCIVPLTALRNRFVAGPRLGENGPCFVACLLPSGFTA
jgi:hypothetical protein